MLILTFDDMPEQPKKTTSNWPYLITVGFMAALGTIGILVLTKLRPTQDNTLIITMITGWLGTITGVILTFMKAQETHLSVNSRLDAFMASARQVGHLEGKEEGRIAGIQEAELRRPVPMQAVIPVVIQPVPAPALPLVQPAPTDAANIKKEP
jgi:hypothetical protein